jgi:hypothetical protein
MSILRATLADVDLLCGYLHDANFQTSDITMDSNAKLFSLKLERICYEKREVSKALFFIPVIRYPWINSRLAVTGVERLESTKTDKEKEQADDRHLLLDIRLKGNDRLEIASDDLRLSLFVTQSSQITLEDLADALPGRKVTDFSRSIFQGMAEIDRLRVDGKAGVT